MASVDDNNAMPTIPGLPPLVGIDGQTYQDEVPQLFLGQNPSPTAAATSAYTPPPYRINLGCSNDPSTMSSLTAPVTAAASAASRRRNRDESGSSDEDEPSPKKAFPDFNLRKSEEDSIASGDDSDGWDKEEGRVMRDLAAQAKADDVLDDAVFPDV